MSWALQFKWDIEKLVWVQQKDIRMVKGQEQKSWGREIEGTGLAQSGKEEAVISPWPPTV